MSIVTTRRIPDRGSDVQGAMHPGRPNSCSSLSPLELSPLDVLPLDVLPLDVLLLDVLLLDNRDSFTFNLAQAFGELGCSVEVVDADLVSAAQIVALRESGRGPRVVVVGPGPRGPADLPRLVDLVQQLDGRVPLFGVCLGLQVLVRARGGQVARALEPVHGKVRRVHHEGSGCFAGLPDPTWVMRYHSLVASEVPPSLTVTAVDDDGQVMAVRDAARSVQAVQFHPESVGTAGGLSLLRNVVVEAGVAVPDVVARPGGVPPPSWTPAFGYGANGLGAGAPAGPANDQHRGGQ